MKFYLGVARIWINATYLQELIERLLSYSFFSLNYDNVFQETLRQETVRHFPWENAVLLWWFSNPIFLHMKKHLLLHTVHGYFSKMQRMVWSRKESLFLLWLLFSLLLPQNVWQWKTVRKQSLNQHREWTNDNENLYLLGNFIFSESGSH